MPMYGPGPGVIIGGVAHGSHGSLGPQGAATAAGMHGLQPAPRQSQSQQRHPTVLLVSITTAVSIQSFFITRISNRNLLVPLGALRHINSTPRFVMCKRNLRIFSDTPPLRFRYP